MGFNSTLFICNDAMNEIDKDPAGWWKKASATLHRTNNQEAVTFGYGSHANYFQAIHQAHADGTVVILAGGNHATILGLSVTTRGDHHDEESQIKVLKEVLDQMGYNVVKKR